MPTPRDLPKMRRVNLPARLRALLLAAAAVIASAQAQGASTPLKPGLVVTAGDGARTVSFLAPTPNFTLRERESLHPQLAPAFKATWTGVLTVLRAGRYTLHANARVLLDGTELQGQPAQLAAGGHALKIEFTRKPGEPARVQLQWESDFFRREPVPWTAFGNRLAEPLPSLADAVPGPVVSEAPLHRFHQLAKQLDCVECHELYGPARRAFGANEAPPPLTDSGNKLRASWLEDVLVRNRRVRPWMTLAPVHHGEAARPLVNLFAQQAGAELGDGEAVAPASGDELAAGVKLLGMGGGGLSCIMCHDFKGHRSAGDLRGPDMTEMRARVRADWLRRWLRDPGRLQSGTAMPAFFSEMPAAQADGKIELLARTLAAGPALPLPEGIGATPGNFKLTARDELIVFRTFIADSPPRSIAVGFPGGVSCVFDAESCRVRHAWTGGFLDVEPLWTGRGGAPAKVVGQRFHTAPSAFPLRIGSADAVPHRVAFKGYELVKSASGVVEAVAFRFEMDGVTVKQTLALAAGGRGVELRFELGGAAKDVWFVAGDDERARVSSSDGEVKDGVVAVRAGRAAKFTVKLEPR